MLVSVLGPQFIDGYVAGVQLNFWFSYKKAGTTDIVTFNGRVAKDSGFRSTAVSERVIDAGRTTVADLLCFISMIPCLKYLS